MWRPWNYIHVRRTRMHLGILITKTIVKTSPSNLTTLTYPETFAPVSRMKGYFFTKSVATSVQNIFVGFGLQLNMCVPKVRVMSLRTDEVSARFCSSRVGWSIHTIIAGGQNSGIWKLFFGFVADTDDPNDVVSSQSSLLDVLGVGEIIREENGDLCVGDGDRISVSWSEVGEAGSIDGWGMDALLVLPCLVAHSPTHTCKNSLQNLGIF